MFCALYIFVVFVFGFSSAEEVLLPPFTFCKRNSTNYSDCLTNAIQKAWPEFIKGLPEFDFPPLEPLFYKFGTVVFDAGLIHAKMNISNFNGDGLSKTLFLAARSHFVDEIFQLEIDTQIPKFSGSGEVEALGSVGLFSLNGNGPFNLTFEDLQTKWIIKGHVVNDVWTVENFYATPSIKKVKIYFNIIKGSKEINDLTVTFVNEFWPSLYRIVIPTAAKVWDSWLCDLVNNFFSKVSFTKIFP